MGEYLKLVEDTLSEKNSLVRKESEQLNEYEYHVDDEGNAVNDEGYRFKSNRSEGTYGLHAHPFGNSYRGKYKNYGPRATYDHPNKPSPDAPPAVDHHTEAKKHYDLAKSEKDPAKAAEYKKIANRHYAQHKASQGK